MASDDSLPAATTTTEPCASASSIASWTALGQLPAPPRLMLITFAGYGLGGTPAICTPDAHSMPSKTSSSVPPHSPSTRTGRIREKRSMPDIPIPLFTSARHDPRDEGAVPRARMTREPAAGAVLDPVAFVARGRVARAAVARKARVRDEVIARKDPVREIGMRQDAGVDQRDRRAGRGRLQLQVPRRLDVDAVQRIRERPLVSEERIVRYELREAPPHRIGVLHRRIVLEARRHLRESVDPHGRHEPHHPDVADLPLGNRNRAHPLVQAWQQRDPVRSRVTRKPHEELGPDVDVRARRVPGGGAGGALRLRTAVRRGRLDPEHRALRAEPDELRLQFRGVLWLGQRELERTGARRSDLRELRAEQGLEPRLVRRRECARRHGIRIHPHADRGDGFGLGHGNRRRGEQNKAERAGAEAGGARQGTCDRGRPMTHECSLWSSAARCQWHQNVLIGAAGPPMVAQCRRRGK